MLASIMPVPSAAILTVLVRTEVPLSGRQVAALTGGRASQARTHDILRRLVEAGVVLVEERPPSRLYRLNRDHVAAAAITELVGLRGLLLGRMRQELAGWAVPPVAAWLFGSAARQDGSLSSDVDVFVVRPGQVGEDDPVWSGQLERLSAAVWRWTGNSCEIVTVGETELGEMVRAGERLVSELRADAIPLTGANPAALLRPTGHRPGPGGQRPGGGESLPSATVPPSGDRISGAPAEDHEWSGQVAP